MSELPPGSQSTAADEVPLLDHDFDGIREADRLPPWWFTTLFWVTVIWAVVYGLHYTFGPKNVGVLAWKEHDAEIQELKARSSTGPLSEEQMRALSTSASRVEAGKQLYASAGCVTCHGPDGLGMVGPNLRDRFWIHGSSMSQMQTVIAEGAAGNIMPAQKNLLSGNDITNLTIYLVSLSRAGLRDGKAIDPAREKDQPINY